ncbi:MAG: ATP/GTP-binding protein [Bacteroidetes bacterium]|nr:MAG: ATP/GTP-binding protein [Bacteroidota bacterium]
MNLFVLITGGLIVGLPSIAQQHQLVKKWQTDSVLKVPESVYYDAANKVLYTSNIDGAPDGKDGKGSIGKIGLDGKIIQVDWVTGLNAPKGLGKFNNLLYAADLDEVAVIDLNAGKIVQRIPVEGAAFLNDITVDSKGVVYVSDTKTGKVHRIENGNVSTYATGIEGANGVLADGTDLYVLGNGNLWKISKDKQRTKVASGMDASTDGIEKVKDNEFVVSSWNGVIYYVKSDGSKQQLLDTRPQKINSADIGYDAVNRIVYVPTFFRNSVAAYELK